jgi:flavin reductase (DIM6/NTAB) family NADH-FMN oxidoreductase RutF
MQHVNVPMKKAVLNIDQEKVVSLLQPSKPILCTTKDEDGTDRVAPFGWCTPVSQQPPFLALAIHHSPEKSKSLGNIERTGEFVINIPHLGIAEETILASFPREGLPCKFDCSEFTREVSKFVLPVGIKECVASLECKSENIRYIGDHALIIGRIVYARYNPAAYKDNSWNAKHFRPLIHLGHHYLKNGSQVNEFLNGNETAIEIIFEKNINESRNNK